MDTDIYAPAFNCFLPGSWDGSFPVWGFRYSPEFARVQIFGNPDQRDRVLEAFNFQARKLGLGFEASPEGERAIVYPNNGYITLEEFLDEGCNLALWVDRFLEAMASLWPKQALVEFGVDSIAVSSTGIPFYLDWSLAIVGPAVRKEFPSRRYYYLFLCQFMELR
ncbi:MAG: hypothetical protein CH104c_0407 [Candidatus Woesebacteria bacterium]|nr:MAG: hypothetical protein CH104c_0407 [Candidatus Woesebacteria bacterium]